MRVEAVEAGRQYLAVPNGGGEARLDEEPGLGAAVPEGGVQEGGFIRWDQNVLASVICAL